jgi:Fe-S-cluster containining protein
MMWDGLEPVRPAEGGRGLGLNLAQIDAAMAEAVRKSGAWIACRAGCFECCIGPFPITQDDARRLRSGLSRLAGTDPGLAARLQHRARIHVEADEAPCPALDPETGTCDLYDDRPVTCRTFGPAVRSGGQVVGVCELCYVGATDEEIASCAVQVDLDDVQDGQETTVALALA